MANITPTIVAIGDAVLVEWDQINEDDEGATTKGVREGEGLARYPDKTVQFSGTFNGGAYALEGSMDGSAWDACHSLGGDVAAGSAISFSAIGSAVLAQNFRHYRVTNDNNGTTEDVNVHMTCV